MGKINYGSASRLAIKAVKRLFGVRSPDRFGINTTEEAIVVLVEQVVKLVSTSNRKGVLLVADSDDRLSDKISSILLHNELDVQKTSIQEIEQLSANHVQNISCVVAAFFDPKKLTQLGLELIRNRALEEIPFEFCIIPKEVYPIMLKYDRENSHSFISPLLMSNIKYFDIYESSLSIFEMKCQVRDFMDLCQILEETFKRNIEGDLAEFGSWKGHSGYLISKIMKEHNTQKRLYMFDMF